VEAVRACGRDSTASVVATEDREPVYASFVVCLLDPMDVAASRPGFALAGRSPVIHPESQPPHSAGVPVHGGNTGKLRGLRRKLGPK
jgi:hypothetical protein